MTTEEKFQAAVNIIRSLPKDGPYQPSHDMMLKFYGLYKQAVEGPCHEPKPAFYEVVKGYKWQAWNKLGAMTKAEAMNCYVDELKKIIETMAYTENVANFIDALGPFYEYIDIDLPGKKRLNNNIKGLPGGGDDLSDSGNDASEGSGSPITNGGWIPGIPVHHNTNTTALPRGRLETSEEEEEEEKEEERGEEVEEEEEEEEEEKEEEEVLQVEAESTPQKPPLAHKVYSDSDTDEEYSEPAESLDHLCVGPQACTPPLHPSHAQVVEPLEGALTHGGGDKSHPGGLQMTPRQRTQGSAGSSHPHSPSSGSFTSPSHSRGVGQGSWGGGGAGGGGRGGGEGGGGGGSGGGTLEEDVSAQLVVVLRRLQTDMESVLHRLNTLETLAVTHQHHTLCHQCQGLSGVAGEGSNGAGRSWWPFPELSPRSTFFLLMWPLLLHGGLKLLPLLRCRRKRS